MFSGLRVNARTGEVWGACMASVEPEVHPLLFMVADSVRTSKMQVLGEDKQCTLLSGSITRIQVKMM